MSDRKGVIIIYLTDTAVVSVFSHLLLFIFLIPPVNMDQLLSSRTTVTMRCWFLVDAMVADGVMAGKGAFNYILVMNSLI